MDDVRALVDRAAARTQFSGAVRVDLPGAQPLRVAYGLADRRTGAENTPDTRFAGASLTKGFTAVVVLRLVEQGRLALTTRVREVLGADLPLIDDAVTVEHLLAHRSGIGDYCDEYVEVEDEEALPPFAVQSLACTEDYVAVLDGYPQKAAPGEGFAYNNGGFVVLALVAERAGGRRFTELIDEFVCGPAGMRDTAFIRSDALPPGTATGYLAPEGLRTNIFHLPLVGSGDGGIYSSVDDLHRFWEAFFAGALVSQETVAAMVAPRSELPPGDPRGYGMGVWLGPPHDVYLEGADIGVSCRTVCNRGAGITYTAMSNTTDGAWPVLRELREHFAPA